MNRVKSISRRLPLPGFVAVLLALWTLPLQSAGQAAQNQPTPSSQLQPVSLPHLYWHFLIHQSELDAFAAKLTAKGQDGQALRNDMQTRLGFSDADYAPIRTASQQLTAELQPIEAQLKALQGTAWSPNQVRALIAQRETYISNAVYTLSIELSPRNKATLESFMTAFFAPKNVSAAISAAGSAKAVQQ